MSSVTRFKVTLAEKSTGMSPLFRTVLPTVVGFIKTSSDSVFLKNGSAQVKAICPACLSLKESESKFFDFAQIKQSLVSVLKYNGIILLLFTALTKSSLFCSILPTGEIVATISRLGILLEPYSEPS